MMAKSRAVFIDALRSSGCWPLDEAIWLIVISHIPPGCGLGSSAAFSMAISREIHRYFNLKDDSNTVLSCAHRAEALFHRGGSGVDIAGIERGFTQYLLTPIPKETSAVGAFQWPFEFERIGESPFLWLVACTQQQRRTSDAVGLVAKFRAEHPDRFADLQARNECLSHQIMMNMLDEHRAADLGRCLDESHDMLCELGVSTPQLNELCALLKTYGAYGAKLTGAGLGGCVVAVFDIKTWQEVRGKLLLDNAFQKLGHIVLMSKEI